MSCFPGNTYTIIIRNNSDPKGIRCVTEVINTKTNNYNILTDQKTPLYKNINNVSHPRPPVKLSTPGREEKGRSQASGVTLRVAGVALSAQVSLQSSLSPPDGEGGRSSQGWCDLPRVTPMRSSKHHSVLGTLAFPQCIPPRSLVVVWGKRRKTVKQN